MAGHVPRRVLKKPEVDKCLLGGTTLYRWEEGADFNLLKLNFFADNDGFFLWAKGDDQNKTYEQYIWDFNMISDVRTGKLPKDSKLAFLAKGSDNSEDVSLTLVYRRDGIINLDFHNLIAESPQVADNFKKAVNALTANMLNSHATPTVFFKKHLLRIKLHANGRGQIPLKVLNRLMMIRFTADNFINQWLAGFNIVKEMPDGKTKYIQVEDFDEEIFMKMVDQVLNNRVDDLDTVFASLATKSHKAKQALPLADFHRFLNEEQRDPRLNEILYKHASKSLASQLISRHEKGRSKDRMTTKGLMEYLTSDENNILDVEHLNQTNDMSMPMSHYFINSSHNTYLIGHQLRSASTTEMYAQALLLGCRCVELDCWPENDDIIITHGGTFCGKVGFKEVVETINEFAFVTSEYPIILSIENHCRNKPALMHRMAQIFKVTFGNKLLSTPLDEFPNDPGVPLPPPERLKYRILIKDKVKRSKDSQFGTLPRVGTSVPGSLSEIPEEQGEIKEQESDVKSQDSEASDIPEHALAASCVTPDSKTPPTENGDTPPVEETKKEETDSSGVTPGTPQTDEGVASGNGGDGGLTMTSDQEETGSKNENETGDTTSNSPSEDAEDKSQANLPLHLQKRGSATEGDITKIDVALIHRSSETYVTGPYADILNYCTSVPFEGFNAAEKVNCSFYMSSFVEEKGMSLIKTQPKDFVKYNMRQFSRVYPQGSRVSSSNYLPVIFWNAGMQMVALNYQTPDIPMQLNTAKFEFNGATGWLSKPWVMNRERTGLGGGIFNPFVQSKLEDIVPAKLSIQFISGYFLTDKRTSCYVETELYGLPADTVKHRFFTRKQPAPHCHWTDGKFVFKRILLPELALLRVGVYDEDKELVGQRSFPVNAIRPGFRHINLRDKHGAPLPLAMLFVRITVEDWVPDEMEDIVAMLMDPISFASQALKEMEVGLDEDEKKFRRLQTGGESVDSGRGGGGAGGSGKLGVTDDSKKPRSPSPANPSPKPADLTDMFGMPLPAQLPSSQSSQSLPRDKAVAVAAPTILPYSFADTLPCLDKAKQRGAPEAVDQDSKSISEHSDLRKLNQKLSKQRDSLTKKHDKDIRKLREKMLKPKSGIPETAVQEMEQKQQVELIDFDKKASGERYEKKRQLIEASHKTQMKDLTVKIHKADIKTMSVELTEEMRKFRDRELGGGVSDGINRKQSMAEIEDKTIQLGKKARNEFERIHSAEVNTLQERQKKIISQLVQNQAKELDDLNSRKKIVGDKDSGATVAEL